MKNLLYKELKLCMNPQAYIFLFFGCFTLMPSYPLYIIPIFFMSSISSIIAFAKEANDIFYTATLPIKRSDVVKSKVLFFATIETIFIALTSVFMIISILLSKYVPGYADGGSASGEVVSTSKNSTGMTANITIFGIYFIVFGIYNLIFCPWWYKKPEKFTAPFFVAMIVSTMISAILGTTVLYIPFLDTYFNAVTYNNWYFQLIFLVVSFGLFVLLSFIATKISQKKFQKIDI